MIFESIINDIPAPQVDENDGKGAQLLVAALAGDNYLGKYAIGKIFRGKLKKGQTVKLLQRDGSTQAKIEENKKKINNAAVTSTVDGIITKINDDTNPYTTDGTFITILASKEMRVKGQINEQNVWAINVDEPVTIRSRVDADKTWKGTITKIDTESKQEKSDNYSYGSNSEENSTKYPFYITLESSEGLMMGQHLYIELGNTSGSEIDFSDGTYLYDYYIAYDEEGKPFVWADKNGKLVKTYIELGDYNEEQMVYSISGIDKDTKLAYPMEDFTEGMKTVSAGEGEAL